MKTIVEGVAGPSGVATDGLETRVAVESMRPHWEQVLRWAHRRFRSSENVENARGGYGAGSLDGAFDAEAFCVWADLTMDEYEYLRHSFKRASTVPYDLCDRVLVAAGMEWVVTSLYIVHQPPRAMPQGRKAS